MGKLKHMFVHNTEFQFSVRQIYFNSKYLFLGAKLLSTDYFVRPASAILSIRYDSKLAERLSLRGELVCFFSIS